MKKSRYKECLLQFYTDMIFYQFCPIQMQTASLCEKILLEANQVWQGWGIILDQDECMEPIDAALHYVMRLFNLPSVRKDGLIVYGLDGLCVDNLLETLRIHARSTTAKSYLGI